MINGTSNNHKLKDKSPYDDDPKWMVHLKMYYSITGDTYHFCYTGEVITQVGSLIEVVPAFPEGEREFGSFKVGLNEEGQKIVLEKYTQELDIGIRPGFDRVLVIVETIDNGEFKDMFWHQDSKIEAIMTEREHEYYGHLKYSKDNVKWDKIIPAEPCRLIRFKAKEKSGDPELHKFSYNVRLPGFANFVEIDPDIQNPKVD